MTTNTRNAFVLPRSVNCAALAVAGLMSTSAVHEACSQGAVDIQNPNVVAGQATFNAGPDSWQIHAGHRAIIEYSRFNIGAGGAVQFIQPGAYAAVLNRINSADPSMINGALSSNGILYFVNPAGITFGPDAVLNVGQLYAAAGSLSNSDFLGGVNHFTSLSGAVTNEGTIQAGGVALLGQHVANRGRILTPNGFTTFAAAARVLLAPDDSGLIVQIERDQPAGEQPAAGSAEALASEAGITNTGTVDARGGSFIAATGDLYSLAMDIEGTVLAQNIVVQGGDDGIVAVNGTLDASGAANGSNTGGYIEVTGEYVLLDSAARLLATGQRGGGEILVGGDFQGSNPDVQNAFRTHVSQGAVLDASATYWGNGGKVIIWSNDLTNYAGSIKATGAGPWGQGGFAEVSGKRSLGFRGTANLRGGIAGRSGTLLLDPTNITITNATTSGFVAEVAGTFSASGANDSGELGLDAINAALANGNVVVTTENAAGAGVGNIIWAATAAIDDNGENNELELRADNDITFSTAVNFGTWSGQFDAHAVNNINVNAALTRSAAGYIGLFADSDLNGVGTVSVNAPIDTAGGLLEIEGANYVAGLFAINASEVYLFGSTSTANYTVGAGLAGFGVSDAELDQITADLVGIGHWFPVAGTFTVDGAVSFSGGDLGFSGFSVAVDHGIRLADGATLFIIAASPAAGSLTFGAVNIDADFIEFDIDGALATIVYNAGTRFRDDTGLLNPQGFDVHASDAGAARNVSDFLPTQASFASSNLTGVTISIGVECSNLINDVGALANADVEMFSNGDINLNASGAALNYHSFLVEGPGDMTQTDEIVLTGNFDLFGGGSVEFGDVEVGGALSVFMHGAITQIVDTALDVTLTSSFTSNGGDVRMVEVDNRFGGAVSADTTSDSGGGWVFVNGSGSANLVIGSINTAGANGGDGGWVEVTNFNGTVLINSINASGGDGSVLEDNGGEGGKVEVNAVGLITFAANSSVVADGGDAFIGGGGDGQDAGNIEINGAARLNNGTSFSALGGTGDGLGSDGVNGVSFFDDVILNGSSTFGGGVQFNDFDESTTVLSNSSVSVSGGGLVINGLLNGSVGTETLTLTFADSVGSVLFANEVGTGNGLGALTVANAQGLTAFDNFAPDNFTQSNGAGFTDFQDQVAVSGNFSVTTGVLDMEPAIANLIGGNFTANVSMGGITLGELDVGGNVSVTSVGLIGQAGALTVAGTSSFTSNGGDVFLFDAADVFVNSFGGAVSGTTTGAAGSGGFIVDGSGGASLIIGSINTSGAAGFGGGGVAITNDNLAGTVVINSINTAGGNGSVANPSGGNGGSIEANATGLITLAAGGSIILDGGDALATGGGDGGDAGSLFINSAVQLNNGRSFSALGGAGDGIGDDGFNGDHIFDNSVTLNGASTFVGDVFFNDDGGVTTVLSDSSVTVSEGDLEIFGTLDGVIGGEDLILETGSRDLHFGNDVGGVHALGEVVVTNADEVWVEFDFTAASFTQFAGGVDGTWLEGDTILSGNLTVSAEQLFMIGDSTTIGGNFTANLSGGGIDIGALDVAGNMSVTSDGEITQDAGMTVDGTSSFTSNGFAVLLGEAGNSFGGAVSIDTTGAGDGGAVDLNGSSGAVLTIGTIDSSGTAGGAGGNVSISNNNVAGEVVVHLIDASGADGVVGSVNGGTAGNVTVSATGLITFATGSSVTANGGDAVVASGGFGGIGGGITVVGAARLDDDAAFSALGGAGEGGDGFNGTSSFEDVILNGDSTFVGDVVFNSPVEFPPPVFSTTVLSNSSVTVTGGELEIYGLLNGSVGTESLTVTIADGLGSVGFFDAVGTDNGMGAIVVANANGLTAFSTISAASFTQSASTGFSNFQGQVDVAGNFSVTADVLDMDSALVNLIGGNFTANVGGSIELEALDVGGNLSVTAHGEINQAVALTVDGTSSFTSNGGDVNLFDDGNSFGGAVSGNTTSAFGSGTFVVDGSGGATLTIGSINTSGASGFSGGSVTVTNDNVAGTVVINSINASGGDGDEFNISGGNAGGVNAEATLGITLAVNSSIIADGGDALLQSFGNGGNGSSIVMNSAAQLNDGTVFSALGGSNGGPGADGVDGFNGENTFVDDVTLNGDSTFGGFVRFNDDNGVTTVLSNSTVTMTEDGIIIHGALDGFVGTETLTLTIAGGFGAVDLFDDVGAGNGMGAIVVANAHGLRVTGTLSAASFTQSAGAGLSEFFVPVDVAGNFSVTTDVLVMNSGAVNLVGGNFTASVSGAIELAALDVGGSVSVTSVGEITQAAALTVDGTSSFTSNGFNVSLFDDGNSFGGAVSGDTTSTVFSGGFVVDGSGGLILTIGSIDTSGAGGFSGGGVAVTNNNLAGTVVINSINASGGDGIVAGGAGSNGGSIEAQATLGVTMAVNSSIIVDGGDGGGLGDFDGGSAGSIFINSAAQLNDGVVFSALGGTAAGLGIGGSNGDTFFDGDVTLNGDSTFGGDAIFNDFGGDTTVLSNSTVTVSGGGLEIFGTLNGVLGSEALTVTMVAGGGAVGFFDEVGTGAGLGALVVANATGITAFSEFAPDSFTQSASTGFTDFQGQVNVAGNFSVTAGDLQMDSGLVNLIGGNFTANVSLGGIVLAALDVGGNMSVTTFGNVTANGDVTVQGTSSFTTNGGTVVLSSFPFSHEFVGALSINTTGAGGGGSVQLSTIASLNIGTINTSGTDGANGGLVQLNTGGTMNVLNISTNGGDGAVNGGNAENIFLQAAGGVTIAAGGVLSSNGGIGAAGFGGSGDLIEFDLANPVTVGAGALISAVGGRGDAGAGGDGGRIRFEGAVSVTGVVLDVSGGIGTPNGLAGSIIFAPGTTTTLSGNSTFSGDVSLGAVDLAASASITTTGVLTLGAVIGTGSNFSVTGSDVVLTAAFTDVGTFTVAGSGNQTLGLGTPGAAFVPAIDLTQAEIDFLNNGGGGITTLSLGSATYTGDVGIEGGTALVPFVVPFGLVVNQAPGSGAEVFLGTFADGSGAGNITFLGGVVINGSGSTTFVAGTVVAPDFIINDAVQLTADALLQATVGGVTIDGTIAGNFALAIEANGNVLFGDNIGSGADILTSLSVTTLPANTVGFDQDVTEVRASGDITFATSPARTSAPTIATITSANTTGITFDAGGDFSVSASGQKLSSFGDLTINAGGSALLGDLAAVGDITVASGNIVFFTRSAGNVMQTNGTLLPDQGVDVVAGGLLSFQVTPTMSAAGPSVQFASSLANADVNDTIGGNFILRQLPYAVTTADLLSGATILDLRVDGVAGLTSAQLGALAGAIMPMMAQQPSVQVDGDDDEDEQASGKTDSKDQASTESSDGIPGRSGF